MIITPCNREDAKVIVDGLNNYNLSLVAASADIWTPFEYVTRNENGTIIGGVLAGIGYWNGLEIQALWVKEEYRKKGIGKQILQHIECIAVEKGAVISMLDTFDFQAEGFYVKNGYKVVGRIDNFPKGHQRIYLSKTLI